ncbi:hypothetical protein E6P09_18740 (plasmid) [Haloferax mediterranei ATCC 33500]|uniref:DUF8153 domain-containing protein n=1 Tax=Haloferax mediterranei (strain ATCC 33500 / DSM 1411 / JCM 8866 / NBRC 14739 / NCIMB 2177 / R-4) TaxID=523841 RepID=M0J8H8_HALMT|nr:hypothetical protein [Haloferax mediterranei]AHZ24212.1 hypothetical protein BM92_18595 [Haloferax mediterranei ATCC 33500]EMA05291.1 hypothetical protein C439_00790 [Haloferax mediterranei ATCC 33500]MDX5989907.1 hypothetical protein [Haloferax mediterranei ATCC 33500]QCQ77348.1 hypothetical protein E6P09_18740 [Haloferax mediterranei ATCC 33500]
MHGVFRYSIGLTLSFLLTVTIYHYFDDAYLMVYFSIFLVYTFSIALVLVDPRYVANPSDRKHRRLGGIGGGVGAFTFSSLLQVSIPLGVLGWGMLVFGIVYGVLSARGDEG